MSTTRAVRVVVCEDSVELRELLADGLGSHAALVVAGTAGDAASIVQVAAQARPDVVLLDLLVPGAEPDELVAAVAAAAPGAAIVSYSGRGPEQLAEPARRLVAEHIEKTTPIAAIGERLVAIAVASSPR
ncbi:MAG TPA: response regulator [Solirubrobacteraceae bacterium]|nr:response regulator [Solirubrobacteraceae bacterium]